MATFKFIFDTQVTNKIQVLVTPTAGTTNGYYGFEITSPVGGVLSSVNANFFSTPATYAQLTTATAATWSGVPFPVDANGKVLYGKYKFKVIARQSGGYGDDDYTFSGINSTEYSFTLTKVKQVFTVTPNQLDDELIFNDSTDYNGATIASRVIVATPLPSGSPQTNTSNSAQLVVTPFGNYQTTLTTDGAKITTLSAAYSAEDRFSVSSIITQTLDFYALGDLVCKAKIKLAEYDDIWCKQGRKLTDAELANYLRVISKLSLIGAGLHVPLNLDCDINETITELSKLV